MQPIKLEVFDNFASFFKSLGRPANRVFAGDSHPASETGTRSFTKTSSYADAEALMRTGYKDPLQQLKKGLKLPQWAPKRPQRVQFNSVVGFTPNVPNYIVGVPLSMIDYTTNPTPARVVTIYYDNACPSRVEAPQIEAAGVQVLQLVNSLEALGYRVNLYLTMILEHENGARGYSLKLKDSKQHLDVLKLAFPLVHPSMLRRFGFKWVETTPLVSDYSFHLGHGCPLTFRKSPAQVADQLKKQGVLKEHDLLITTLDLVDKKTKIEKLLKTFVKK